MIRKNLFPVLCLIGVSFTFGCGSGSNSTTSTEVESPEPEIEIETPVTASSTLVINEIVASAADGGNDWIELYVAQGTADLANFTIVDDNQDHTPQALPQVSLSQGEYIVIEAIDEEDTPPENGYYVTFKLGSEDAVTLFESGVEVDSLAWNDGDAPEGTSFGLAIDGSGDAEQLSPTPGVQNEAATESVVYDLIVNENAALRINEVVAKDSENGDDWIELYASGSESVYLGDYSLRDEDSALMPLPDMTLAAGEYFRVYATTDTLESAASVGFKLGASDQVSLFLADDLVDQLEWKKGQALIGTSYGRFPDGSDGTQVLTPSPVLANVTAQHGPLVINEVVASDPNGGLDWFELYNTGTQSIQLSSYQVIDESDDIDPVSLPNVAISAGEYLVIYATDTDPGSHYVPFKLGKTDELSLLLNDETVDYIDWDDSDVVEGFSYGLSAPDSALRSWDKDFLNPTLGTENALAKAFDFNVVNSLYIDITDENWQSILANPLDEEYHQASITFQGVTLDSVAIRTKGGSSLRSVAQSSSDRYSFKIDINEYVDGQKFFGLKKFTLQNSFNDPTYMREVIAYELLDEIGVPAPERAYVDVYINGELFGFYLMLEVIDGEFLENHFANANGDLYKPDGVGSDLNWIGSNVASYSGINLQNNEESTDQGAFMNFIEHLDRGETDLIDLDTLLRYMSVSVALSNLDSYHGALAHNYYIYEQDGVFSLLPWDFNESFGTFARNCDRVDLRELYIDEPVDGALADRPLVANAFADASNLDTYHDYLWQLIEGPLASQTFAARVQEIATMIRSHVEKDPTAFYGISSFNSNLTSSVERFWGLTEFMDYRVENMTQQLQGNLPSAGNGSGFCSGGSVRP